MAANHGVFRYVLSYAFAAATVAANALGVAAQDAGPTPPPGPSISGVVNGERGPIPGATVSITGPVSRTETTSNLGAFAFTGIPAGTYRLSASAAAHISIKNQVVSTDASNPATLTVTLGTQSLTTLRTIGSTSTTGRGTITINTSGNAQSTLTYQDFIYRGEDQVQNMLEELPGVELTRASSGGAPGANTDIALRGASPYETQTLIDGHPVTGGRYGEYLVQFINPLVLGDIEVDQGPAVFGTTIQNAVNGTVNFRTPPITSRLTGNFTAGYDSFNGSTYSGRISDTIGKFGFLAAYGFLGTPGYFTGNILSVNSITGAQAGVVPDAVVNQEVPSGETFNNRSQVFKLGYNFSPTTSLTLASIGSQSYVDYTATLTTVEPVTIVPCLQATASSPCTGYNNPAYNGLIGQTVLAATQFDNLYQGNFETDNEPIFTADLRTSIGPGSFLARYYTGSITREINDPGEAGQITGFPPPPGTPPTTYGTGYYQSEIDRLQGSDYQFTVPWARNTNDFITASFDEHTDKALACSGTTPDFALVDDCAVNNLNMYSSTISLRAFADVAPKLHVAFGNYWSNTSFVGTRYDPRATLVWTPQKNEAFRFAVGTAYVAPPSGFVAPQAGSNKAVIQNTLNVNDALQPETSAGVDIGTDIGVHGDSKFTLDLYETALTNRFSTITIEPGYPIGTNPFGYYNGVPFNKISELYNASDSNQEGIEFGYVRDPRVGFGGKAYFDLLRAYNYNTVIPQLTPGVAVNGSQTDTISGDGFETPGYQIPGYPYSHGRLELTYRFASTARIAFGQTIYGANNSFGEPGFSLFDFNINAPLNYGLRFNLSGTNIFNHDDYRSLGQYGYGYLPPGESTPYSLFFAPLRRFKLTLIYPIGGAIR